MRKIPTRNLLTILTLAAQGLLTAVAEDPTKLLPFQGLLTRANGTPVNDGTQRVQFKLYDAPIGGTAVWPGEVHQLSVNAGLVSTILGTRTALTEVDFNQRLFLEITVATRPDGPIGPADPPLLPRQVVLPSVLAIEAIQSRTLRAGNHGFYGWEALFGSQDPETGHIPGSRIARETITEDQIEDRAQVPPGTIVAYGGDRVPEGWLLCDGAVYPQFSYPRLFKNIAHRWQEPTDLTQDRFRVPDLRGLFLRGLDPIAKNDPNGRNRNVGNIQGDATRAHTHHLFTTSSSENYVRSGNETIAHSGRNTRGGAQYTMASDSVEPTWGRTGTNPNGPETRPKNAAVNYIIKY